MHSNLNQNINKTTKGAFTCYIIKGGGGEGVSKMLMHDYGGWGGEGVGVVMA